MSGNSTYTVVDNRAFQRLPDETVKPASVEENWSNWSGVFADTPFDLSGVARLFLDIVDGPSGAVVSLSFQNEAGLFPAPNELSADWDHFVAGKTLIPIRNWELELALDVLERVGVEPGFPAPLASIFRLLVEAREAGLPLRAPDEFESLSKFEPKAGQLEGFCATPYPYQSTGIDWLTDYYDNKLGMMLCDEMGLGKTVQALGLIMHALNNNASAILVVVPASLIPNWGREVSNFIPGVDFTEHIGPFRDATPKQLESRRCIITSYETLVNDIELFSSRNFDLIVADEAQALKNHRSKRHSAMGTLRARSKLLMTGTPLENRLIELVSLVEIVSPGLLGSPEKFESLISDDPELARDLGKQASPLILRRRVAEVAKDLPELIEIPSPIRPSRAWVSSYNKKLSEDSSLLAKYTSLTQICCNPALVNPSYVDPDADTKLTRLWEILKEIEDSGEDKVLIFSTYLDSMTLIERFLARHFRTEAIVRIDGSVPPRERQRLVEEFNSTSGFGVMVVNPTAGGVGLNITGANHVIHFNRQWNPALEAQATARAYRRGQTKPVRVHKFYYEGTIEQAIHERLMEKKELADTALLDAELTSRQSADNPPERDQADLMNSLKPLQEGA